MMDGQLDLRYVRDNLGHESISTTSQYLHADDDDRHRATEAGLRLSSGLSIQGLYKQVCDEYPRNVPADASDVVDLLVNNTDEASIVGIQRISR
jgi:hypothetical protein